MRLLAALIVWLALVAPPGLALAQGARPVALELLLAIDASGSIDVDEFELQRAGLAAALTDPEVVTAIEALPDGIAISAVQWSGRRQQVVVVDWRQVRNGAEAAAAAALLAGMNRRLLGETALGEALAFALHQLDRSPFTAPRQVIDVSGDGKTNAGPEPDWTRDEAIGRGVTINALAIVNEQPDLERYYEVHLIGGPGAFVLTAGDFDDFAAAIRQKLLHEIRGGPTAAAPPPARLARRNQTGFPNR
jgi:hypothetical protein